MYRPHGIIPAVATPFRPDESLDCERLGELVARLVEADVDGLFVCGSQGEFYALSVDEHVAVARAAVAAAGGTPVLGGVGAVATGAAVELARRLAGTGVSALTVLPPSIVRLDQSEIRRHIEAVVAAVELPVVIYDHPQRTGNGLSTATLMALAEHPRVVGVKDSAGDLARTLELLAARPDEFSVLIGHDSLIAAALLAGADGAVASTASVAPELPVGILRAVRAGDTAEAHRLQRRLQPLRAAFTLASFPAVVKRAIVLRGLDVGPTRGPVGSLSADAETALAAILGGLDLQPWTEPPGRTGADHGPGVA